MNKFKKDVCTLCPDPAFITWVLKSNRGMAKYLVFKILNDIGHCYIIVRNKLYKYPVCHPKRKAKKKQIIKSKYYNVLNNPFI